MASSRKPRRKPDPDDARLLAALRAAVQAARAPAESPKARRRTPLTIAFSGGVDSMALLDAACDLRDQRARGFGALQAVHVHHGLQPDADDWAAFCAAQCEQLDVPFVLQRVRVERRGQGIEAAAREARYAALATAALASGSDCVLTAHHLDDRIETFLLQWLRGAGPDGLAGMPAVRAFADAQLRLVRPWLAFSREQLHARAKRRGLRFVDDPSNADLRLARNAIRAQVLPVLAQLRKGYRDSAARSIDLVASAAEALREVAVADLAHATDGAPQGMLRIDRLASLTPARRALVLRRWLSEQELALPSRARLEELLDQALHARTDARLLVRIGQREVRRHRGLLLVRAPDAGRREEVEIHWNGEDAIPVPAWGGMLRFVAAPRAGFAPQWLREQPLLLRARGGGERFKPQPLRPSKTLKRLFQEAAIPEFERARAPLIWRDARLIFVPGLGPDARLVEPGADHVLPQWQSDATLLGG